MGTRRAVRKPDTTAPTLPAASKAGTMTHAERIFLLYTLPARP
jgi:hypothetical protein